MKSEPKMNSLNADDASERVVASGISVKKRRMEINERKNIGILLGVVKTLLSLGSFKKAMDYVCFELNCGLKMEARNWRNPPPKKWYCPQNVRRGKSISFNPSNCPIFGTSSTTILEDGAIPSPQSFHPLDRPFASFICSFIGDNYRINRVGGAHKSTSSKSKTPFNSNPKKWCQNHVPHFVKLFGEWMDFWGIWEDFDRRNLLSKEEEFGHL